MNAASTCTDETADTMSHLTYCGPYAAVVVALPTRRVRVARGEQAPFAPDELEHLDPETWSGLRYGPAVDGPREGIDVPVGETGVLDAVAAIEKLQRKTVARGDALASLIGTLDGRVPEVIAAVGDDREKAAVLLRLERSGKNRKTLVAALEAIAGTDTTEADMASDPTEEPT